MFGPNQGPRQRRLDKFVITLVAAAAIGSQLSIAPHTMAQGAPYYDAGDDLDVATHAIADRLDAGDEEPSDIYDRSDASVTITEAKGEASRLFSEAEHDLDAGRMSDAERKFERVISLEPESPLAREARAHLGDLYRTGAATPTDPASTPGIAPAEPAVSTDFSTRRSALGAAAVAAKHNQEPPLKRPSSQLSVGTVVAAKVEEEFISTAGDRVFFAAGSADLGQRARAVLASQARWLAQRVDLVAVIEGHSDDTSLSDEKLAELSKARADAVRDRLILEGIDGTRLTTNARGRQQPIADCPSSECAAQNRRVVTVLKQGTSDTRRGPAVAADGPRTQ